MGELTDSTNRADAYALMPPVWAFGATMGSVIIEFLIFFTLLIDWFLGHS